MKGVFLLFSQTTLRLTNNKLSKNIIEKIMKPSLFLNNSEIPNVTKIELLLLLYISTIQDALGSVQGVSYKEICLKLNISKASFYNAIYGLEVKEYIKINYINKDKGFWNCRILDNVFLSDADDKQGYFNTNKAFLNTPEFKNLKVNEMKLCIKLILSYSQKMGLNIYPKNICKWLGIKSVTLAYSYVENISYLFSYKTKKGIQGDLICFLPGNTSIEEANANSERENFLYHKIKYICSKSKICYTLKDIKDLIILFGQYANAGFGKIYTVISYVLNKHRIIKPKLINFLLTVDPKTGEYPQLYWDY